ncbi:MAG: ABC transporter ATP-binding protein [Acidilobaceae archaeon]|nr:ABC transporter ATP-binding protein [Acidilobaceae archaeon]MCX8165395.1 ABC transporter ATP-binding protein [Acidilobaceae archaeon]MDW7973822.1 ABC transporter ATP-binding protein [Sulfolobales archaeon]
MSCKVVLSELWVEREGKEILRGVSAEMEGGLTMIMGPNGAGKTSLLKVIGGIWSPTRGEVEVCGRRRASDLISFVPAYLKVDPYATAVDVVEAFLFNRRSLVESVRGKRGKEVLDSMGLSSLAHRRFNTLSGGEHKLVMIAGALAREPRVLLLDEPFSHLDLANQQRMAKIITQLRERMTVIVTIHEPLYANLADKLLVMASGRVVAAGRPREVLRKELLEKVYGVKMTELEHNGARVIFPDLADLEGHPV